MQTIYKYVLEIVDKQKVRMPFDGIIRSVQVQHGSLCVWVQVDTKEREGDRHFYIFGTGNPVDRVDGYIGTVQAGAFVWHLFDGGYG